jgi:phage baseplate assembly protein W
MTKLAIKDNIERVVSAEEPRVRLLDIDIVDITEKNAYRVTLKYLIKESNREQDVEIILRRIR